MSGEVTEAIAQFAVRTRFADIPAAVVARGKIHMLDSLGLAFAGAGSGAARILQAHYRDQGIAQEEQRPGWATVIGTALVAPPRFAACANGTAIHADNFDDTTPQVRADRTGGIHASGAVLPVVLALAECGGAPGRDMFAAYHAGVEVASRLNHAMGPRHYGDGFHTTGTLNVFGAAVAAGMMLGLDEDGFRRAIALAASQASGIRRNFGTMAEILHPGHAAECGIVSADLAARGMTGAADALDGPVGYFAAAGTPWVFEDPGVWIKPHPNGALTHPGAACLMALLRDGDVAADDIRAIRVRTNERVLNTLIHHDPDSAMKAKFSMEFTLAIIAVDRRAGLGEFTDENLARADVQEMMRRISFTAYERAEADYTNVTTLVDVELADGSVLSGRADFAHGSTRSPMDFQDVGEKFRQCAAFGGVAVEKAERIIETVAAADSLPDAAGLVQILAQ